MNTEIRRPSNLRCIPVFAAAFVLFLSFFALAFFHSLLWLLLKEKQFQFEKFARLSPLAIISLALCTLCCKYSILLYLFFKHCIIYIYKTKLFNTFCQTVLQLYSDFLKLKKTQGEYVIKIVSDLIR